MNTLPCVIFAGGKSSRMGEDKALLPFASFQTLTEYQLHRLSALFSDIFISCKNADKFDFEANFIEDTSEVYAPTSAFTAVFEALGHKPFFAISVDTPFIDTEIISALRAADNTDVDATIATCKGRLQPLCGIYHPSLYPQFLQMQQNNTHRLNALLKSVTLKKVPFEDEKKFLNLNNPQEYQEALGIVNATLI